MVVPLKVLGIFLKCLASEGAEEAGRCSNKGSILPDRMSCVQNLAVAVKQVGIASKKMAEFPVSKKLRTSQLLFLRKEKKYLNFF